MIGQTPPADDYLSFYRFNDVFNTLDGVTEFNGLEIPRSNTPGDFDTKAQRDRYDDFLEAAGLELKESTIPNAGQGVFTTKARSVGDSAGFYFGNYLLKPPKRHDAAIRLGSGSGGTRDGDLYLQGHPKCPMQYINDPSWGTKDATGQPAGGFETNCEFVENSHLDYSAVNYVAVYTTRDVKAGEELFVDYNLTESTRNRNPSKRRKRRILKEVKNISASNVDGESDDSDAGSYGSDDDDDDDQVAPLSKVDAAKARDERSKRRSQAKGSPTPGGNGQGAENDDQGDDSSSSSGSSGSSSSSSSSSDDDEDGDGDEEGEGVENAGEPTTRLTRLPKKNPKSSQN